MLQQLALTYSYNYSYSTSSSNTHLSSGIILGIVIGALLLAILGIVITWKVFVKAGRPGWAALIPVYNGWVLFEISGKPGWWILFSFLGFIPVVGSLVILVLYIIAMLELAKRFGKSSVFAIFGLVIFSYIGLAILAFGKAQYSAAVPASTDTPPIPPAIPPTPQTPIQPPTESQAPPTTPMPPQSPQPPTNATQ